MKYSQQLDYRRRKRFIRRAWGACFAAFAVVMAFGGFLFYENNKAGNYNSPEQTTSAQVRGYIAPNIQVLRSPYFQFQAGKSWAEDPSDSVEGTYVYRSMRAGLLEQQLTVYVNAAPSDLAVTRVLAVSPSANRGLRVEKLSEHCGKAQPTKDSSIQVTLEQVTFTCFGDDTRYTVLAGLTGATPAISLPRPDGSLAIYTIHYSNLTTSPATNELQEIINSFQTR